MNEKQKMFCKEYLKTKDVKLASKNVGYTEQTGKKLLKNEKIKQYIENILKSKKIAKSDEIIECLTKIMRGEDGQNDNDKTLKGISVKERLKAAELLGKVYAIFSSKPENTEEEPIIILGNESIQE